MIWCMDVSGVQGGDDGFGDLGGWMFWGPARLAIMMFLDESLHQLAGNLLSIVWTVIFALMLS